MFGARSICCIFSALLLVAVVSARNFREESGINMLVDADDGPVRELYEAWLVQYGKVHNGHKEKERRFDIFKDNLNYINEHNAKNSSYRLGLNKFADLTNREFRAKYVGSTFRRARRTEPTSFRYESLDADELPTSVDWRSFGAVTRVKDQGQCGSCWAFSTVAAIEGISAISTRRLVSLSEQELIDCDTSQNSGCDGGLMDYAFEFIIRNGGITTESNYPYTASDGTCDETKEKENVVSINGYEDVPTENENALVKAIANQPVSVAISAGERPFQLYSSGVFDGSCSTDLDHGVTAIGYGTDASGTKYWIVKNSWGTGWGESGYVRMKRTGTGPGICGINIEASYPTKTRYVSSF